MQQYTYPFLVTSESEAAAYHVEVNASAITDAGSLDAFEPESNTARILKLVYRPLSSPPLPCRN